MDNKYIYTFGYTLFYKNGTIDLDRLFKTLSSFGVNFLVDVRTTPFSKMYPQSNADILKSVGKEYNITYIHMPEVGAKADVSQNVFSKASDIFLDNIFPIAKSKRPEGTELNAYDEIVDFEKFRKSDIFLSGINRIKKAYDKSFTLALMCSEKKPIDCHRYFLISRALEQYFGDWLSIKHIIQDDAENILTISNDDLHKQLKEIVFKRAEIKDLRILEQQIFGPALIDKYPGDTNQQKIQSFCDKYWNLMHGWKKYSNNNIEDYD